MRERLRNLVPDPRLLGCLLLGALVYAPTVRGEFVWDDVVFLRRWVGNTDTLREILFPPAGVIGTPYYYRPITQGFATLLWKLAGQTDPTFWHVSIILVHLATIACVYMLLREWWLTPSDPQHRTWGAFAGAAFYACWPANAESVAWISSRADTLLGPFILGALILHLRARDRGRRPLGAALLFLGSLLVKETGVVFLPMAAACTVLLPRGATALDPGPASPAFDPKRFWAPALWLPHLLVYFLYAAMRKFSMGSGTGLSEVAAKMIGWLHPPLVFRAWGFYVQEALGFGASPPFLEVPPATSAVIVFGVIGIVGVGAATLLLLRRQTWPIALTAAWFALPLGPPLATVSAPLSQNSVAVHYLYIPNVALAALLGLLVVAGLRTTAIARFRIAAVPLALALCAGCGWTARQRYEPWMTGVGLWGRAAADNPKSCLAQQNLGIAHWSAQEFEAAERHLLIAAYTCEPQQSQERHGALISLTQFHLMTGQYARARAALREARTLEGHVVMQGRSRELEATLTVFEELGPIKYDGSTSYTVRRDDLRQAVAALEHAVLLDPFAAHPRISLALLYVAVGERPRALRLYEEVERVASAEADRRAARREVDRLRNEMASEPDPVRRAFERGQVAEAQGRTDDALAAFREALAADLSRADVMLAIADLLARKGELSEAAEQAKAATEADDGNAIAWLNLGIYRASSPAKDIAGAEEAFARAREIAPAWPKACANHGRALEVLGRQQDAAVVYTECLAEIPLSNLDSRAALSEALARSRASAPIP